MTTKKYRYSLIPIRDENIMGMFVLAPFIISILSAIIFLKHDPLIAEIIIISAYAITVIFFIPGQFIYLLLPSPFQKTREVIKSLFSSSFSNSFVIRLLVFEDGLEVRRLFSCFFIPYEKMYPLKEDWFIRSKNISFFRYFFIKSTLPEIPDNIRIGINFSRKALDAINEHRDRYMASQRK